MSRSTQNQNSKKVEPTAASHSERAAMQRATLLEGSANLQERLQRENAASRAKALSAQPGGKP